MSNKTMRILLFACLSANFILLFFTEGNIVKSREILKNLQQEQTVDQDSSLVITVNCKQREDDYDHLRDANILASKYQGKIRLNGICIVHDVITDLTKPIEIVPPPNQVQLSDHDYPLLNEENLSCTPSPSLKCDEWKREALYGIPYDWSQNILHLSAKTDHSEGLPE